MGAFNKKQLAIRFCLDGKRCLESAQFLYKEKGNNSQYGILLVHGIELLLKSYLLVKDISIVDETEAIKRYLSKQGHSYLKIYNKCLRQGSELEGSSLRSNLNFLAQMFYSDSISARYTEGNGLIAFDPESFETLKIELIEPVKRLNNLP